MKREELQKKSIDYGISMKREFVVVWCFDKVVPTKNHAFLSEWYLKPDKNGIKQYRSDKKRAFIVRTVCAI